MNNWYVFVGGVTLSTVYPSKEAAEQALVEYQRSIGWTEQDIKDGFRVVSPETV